MEQSELQENLAEIDESAAFLAAIILAVLLSFRGLLLQREGICAALLGREADLSCLYPLRHAASAITAGALAYFLCVTARALGSADRSDPVSVHSAQANLAASALVFTAAAIRFDDVEFLKANGRFPG